MKNSRGLTGGQTGRTSPTGQTSSQSELKIFYGEFDPGSERTLAAWIRHASRTLVAIQEWRKGEEHVSNLPSSWE